MKRKRKSCAHFFFSFYSSMWDLVFAVFCSPLPVCSTCRYVYILRQLSGRLLPSLALQQEILVVPTPIESYTSARALTHQPPPFIRDSGVVCRTKFPMSTLKRLGFGARPPGSGAGGGGSATPKPRKRKAPPTDAAAASNRPSPAPTAVGTPAALS